MASLFCRGHSLRRHCFGLRRLSAKELGEEAGLLRVVGMSLAALRLRHATHDLIDVLATATPGCLAALTASHFAAHVVFLKSSGVLTLSKVWAGIIRRKPIIPLGVCAPV